MSVHEYREAVGLALGSVRANKMRAFLTILGVLIGVASVIGMVSIISGFNNAIRSDIESLGASLIFVSKYKIGIQMGRRSASERNRPPMTYEDAIVIKENCPSVTAVSPQNYAPERLTAKFRGNEARNLRLFGTLSDYMHVNNVTVEYGRFFNETDNHFRRMGCVLGADVANALFPNIDPIGKEILVKHWRFSVLGVLEGKDEAFGDNQNNLIILPYNTFAILYPREVELWLVCSATSPDHIDAAIDEITEVLRRYRGLAYNEDNNFSVTTQESLQDQWDQITGVIWIAMIVISSIGLLVGGVGVMNIMLVSVTERTREIGIRKAVGARKRNIVWQFLIEAMTLTGIGGILGILAGLGIAALVDAVSPLPASPSATSIIVAFSVSVGIGLIFGIYPAYRAARVDPIISLHYE